MDDLQQFGESPDSDDDETQGETHFHRKRVEGDFAGVVVSTLVKGCPGPGPDSCVPYGYALGVVGSECIRFGGGLGNDGTVWSGIAEELPTVQSAKEPGASVAIDFALESGEAKRIRFVLAWYAPFWPATRNINMYWLRLKNPLEVAQLLSREGESLLQRVLARQQVIYSDEKLPLFLRDALVNSLHTMTKNSSYVSLPGAGTDDGLLALMEAGRNIPLQETMCVAWVGRFPHSVFLPQVKTVDAAGVRSLSVGRWKSTLFPRT